MPIIESVSIEGFWGNHSVYLPFNPDVTFLVGKNGSGKTTAINILAAALMCDEDTLEQFPFDKIEIILFDKATRRKPSITVERITSDENPYPSIEYKIKDSAKSTQDEIRSYSPFGLRSQTYQSYQSRRDPATGRVRQIKQHSDFITRELRQELALLVKMNWLSINRITTSRRGPDRASGDTTVDIKLREISERLERYFSELSSNASSETRDFQRKFFRSVIQLDTTFSLSGNLSELNLEEEKSSLVDIFDRFNIPANEYRSDADTFFSHLQKIKDEGEKATFSPEDLVALISASKFHALVVDWNVAVEAERVILQPREAFVKILDSMYHLKKAEVLPSGEMLFRSQSGKELRIFELSSGEKQLFIILGEALLQRDAEWTYIADEPELSLHVDWQEVLVDNLRALNANSQVIFATHSPDIVSHFSDNVVDMQKALDGI